MIHIALAEMYVSCNEAPWRYSKWQEVTGIHHGLFPVEDGLLPLDWTRQVAEEISSYFRAYALRPTPIDRASFSTSPNAKQLPGRDRWVEFCDKIWQMCDIHSRIASILIENNHHIISAQRTEDWPFSSFFIPEVLRSVQVDLFGIDDIGQGDPSLVVIISETWIHLRTLHKRCRFGVKISKRAALKALDGTWNSYPFYAMLKFLRSARKESSYEGKNKGCSFQSSLLEGSLPRACINGG
jgi:TATA-binding protein-associated factor